MRNFVIIMANSKNYTCQVSKRDKSVQLYWVCHAVRVVCFQIYILYNDNPLSTHDVVRCYI